MLAAYDCHYLAVLQSISTMLGYMLGSRSAVRTLPSKGYRLNQGRLKLASHCSIISKVSDKALFDSSNTIKVFRSFAVTKAYRILGNIRQSEVGLTAS